MLQRSDVAGNAWADHNQILISKCTFAVLAGLNRNAAVKQRRNLITELILALGIAYGYARATRLQEERGSYARLSQSNHQNPLAFNIHRFNPALEQPDF